MARKRKRKGKGKGRGPRPQPEAVAGGEGPETPPAEQPPARRKEARQKPVPAREPAPQPRRKDSGGIMRYLSGKRMAESLREAGKEEEHKRIRDYLAENAEMLFVAVVYALFIKFFVVEAFRIPSASMEPTLIGSAQISDKILVAKNHYLFFGEPERWDVSVFKYPNNRSRAYIKRITGTPGDWIMVRDGDILRTPPGEDGAPGTPEPCHREDRLVLDRMLYCLYPGERSLTAVLHRTPPPVPRVDEAWQPIPPARITDFTFLDEVRGFACKQAGGGNPGGAPPEVTRWVRYMGIVDNTQETHGGASPPAERRVAVEDIAIEANLALAPSTRAAGGVSTDLVQATFFVDSSPAEQGVGSCGLAVAVARKTGEAPEPLDATSTPLPAEVAAQLANGDEVPLRFEHIDFRLRLYLDEQLVTELTYPVRQKDLDAEHVIVRLGASGTATFTELALYRDIFYTAPAKASSVSIYHEAGLLEGDPPTLPAVPSPFVNYPVRIPEGHFVMMGDHSANSADSRHWHLAGYLEDGEPRVFEDAPYALAGSLRPEPNPRRLDIYGRTFTPDAERADRNPDGSPILLGYWMVNGELRRGFKDLREAGDGKATFIDLEGSRQGVDPVSTQPVHCYVFRDERIAPEALTGVTSPGRSFSLLAVVVDRQEDGSYLALVPRPGARNGLREITIPPGFAATKVPHVVWSPFVSRGQLMGKAFSVFWPGGITRGRHLALQRFRYIR